MESIELPNTFCGCMNLRTGGKIISVVCTVTSLIAFFVFDFYLDSEPSEVVKEIGGRDQEMLKKLQESNETVRYFALGLFFLTMILFVTSCNLWTAISKDERKSARGFLVFLAIAVVLWTVLLPLQKSVEMFFIVFAVDAILIYFWICVFSLYKKIKETELIPSDVTSE